MPFLLCTNTARPTTEDERQFASDVQLALQRCGFALKQAALLMDLSMPQLSNQLAGREHISSYRLLKLGWHFELTLFSIRAARHGVEVLPPGSLREFYLTVVRQLGLQQKDVA
jgi:hypothetical protein